MHTPQTDSELVDNLEVILSTMRHQLGNSVNAIKITLDVLKQNFDLFNDGKKMDYLDRGAQLLARQQVLIEAMKSYSKFDVREQTDIDVIAFWEHVTALASERTKGSGVHLTVQSDLQACSVHGSMMALEKIMACVLENAVEAVQGAEYPRVDLEASTGREGLIVSFRDNGIGIPAADLHRVRIPLFTTKPGRTGMGLSIAHKLLLRMNGRMSIESEPQNGTCVQITFNTV